MIKLADSKISGERYIVNAENISHHDFVNLLSNAMNRPLPVHKITPFIMKTACAAEKLRSLLTGQPPRISLKSLEIAANSTAYSNHKITETLGMDFIPVKESVDFAAKIYQSEKHH
jgi:NAD dependent epimerase/dehydratase family enzyme